MFGNRAERSRMATDEQIFREAEKLANVDGTVDDFMRSRLAEDAKLIKELQALLSKLVIPITTASLLMPSQCKATDEMGKITESIKQARIRASTVVKWLDEQKGAIAHDN